MRPINSNAGGRVAVLLVVFASLALAACGGSSKDSSSTNTTTNAAATATTKAPTKATASAAANTRTNASSTTHTHPGQPRVHATALRACLQQHGIALPKLARGERPPAGGGPLLPKGVTRSQYEATVKKCGGLSLFKAGRLRSTAIKQALAKFTSCMRANGISLPAPDAAHKSPLRDSRDRTQNVKALTKAEARCRVYLARAFHAAPGLRQGG